MSGRGPKTLSQKAARRARDFHAGIDAAREATLPLVAREFFLRGMGAGALVTAVVLLSLLLVGVEFGVVVLRF